MIDKKIADYYFFNKIIKKNEKIIIYPNINGFILGVFVFFCFLISVFYENNFSLLISITIFFIFFLSIIVSNENLVNLTISSPNQYLVQANKKTYLDLRVLNEKKTKKLNIDLYLDNEYKKNINFLNEVNNIKLNYYSKKRGVKNFNKITFKSIFPFGVIRTKRNYVYKKKVYVYPEPKQPNFEILSKFNLLSNNYNNEFDTIDNYKLGDSPSKIAWKKSLIKNEKYIKFNRLNRFRATLIFILQLMKKILSLILIYFKIFTKSFSFSENFNEDKKLIFDLDEYNNLNFEDLLCFTTFVFLEAYKFNKKINLKHKDKYFELNSSQISLNKILEYLSNV